MSHLPTLGAALPLVPLPTSVLAHLEGAGTDLLSGGWVSTADAQVRGLRIYTMIRELQITGPTMLPIFWIFSWSVS